MISSFGSCPVTNTLLPLGNRISLVSGPLPELSPSFLLHVNILCLRGVSGFLWVFCKGPSAYKIYIYILIYLTYEIKDALEGNKFPFLKRIYHKCGQWYASASQSKQCYFLMGQEDVSPRTTQRKQSRPKQLFWLNPVCENLLFHKL